MEIHIKHYDTMMQVLKMMLCYVNSWLLIFSLIVNGHAHAHACVRLHCIFPFKSVCLQDKQIPILKLNFKKTLWSLKPNQISKIIHILSRVIFFYHFTSKYNFIEFVKSRCNFMLKKKVFQTWNTKQTIAVHQNPFVSSQTLSCCLGAFHRLTWLDESCNL